MRQVAAYNQDDWLPTATYYKEWGASLRSTQTGKDMLVEYKARQVHKFQLLHKRRLAAKSSSRSWSAPPKTPPPPGRPRSPRAAPTRTSTTASHSVC